MPERAAEDERSLTRFLRGRHAVHGPTPDGVAVVRSVRRGEIFLSLAAPDGPTQKCHNHLLKLWKRICDRAPASVHSLTESARPAEERFGEGPQGEARGPQYRRMQDLFAAADSNNSELGWFRSEAGWARGDFNPHPAPARNLLRG
jgi:hypothetical protein